MGKQASLTFNIIQLVIKLAISSTKKQSCDDILVSRFKVVLVHLDFNSICNLQSYIFTNAINEQRLAKCVFDASFYNCVT